MEQSKSVFVNHVTSSNRPAPSSPILPRTGCTASITGVIDFRDIDGATFYHLQLSDGQLLMRRYSQIHWMYDHLPVGTALEKLSQIAFPRKTGVRNANKVEKSFRLEQFDSLFKMIVVEPSLVGSKAFQYFLEDKPRLCPPDPWNSWVRLLYCLTTSQSLP